MSDSSSDSDWSVQGPGPETAASLALTLPGATPATPAPADPCVVCAERISVPMKIFPCGHACIGFKCIEKWVVGEAHTTCPMCRTEIRGIWYGTGFHKLLRVADESVDEGDEGDDEHSDDDSHRYRLSRRNRRNRRDNHNMSAPELTDQELIQQYVMYETHAYEESSARVHDFLSTTARDLPPLEPWMARIMNRRWREDGEPRTILTIPHEAARLVREGHLRPYWSVTSFDRETTEPSAPYRFRLGAERFRNFHPGYLDWSFMIYDGPNLGRRNFKELEAWLLDNHTRMQDRCIFEIDMYNEERSFVYRNALYAFYPQGRVTSNDVADAALVGAYPWDHRPQTIRQSGVLQYFAYLFTMRELGVLWYPHNPSRRSEDTFGGRLALSREKVMFMHYIVHEIVCSIDTYDIGDMHEARLATVMGSVMIVRHFFHELRCFLGSFLHARKRPGSLGTYSTYAYGRGENLGGPAADEEHRRQNMPDEGSEMSRYLERRMWFPTDMYPS